MFMNSFKALNQLYECIKIIIRLEKIILQQKNKTKQKGIIL